MIDGKSVLAVITARGGSKGLPNKNIRMLGPRPLIAWSIEAAQGSQYIDRLITSTDDRKIMTVAQEWGCEVPFLRPPHLANDTARTEDSLLHALDSLEMKYDILVLLQPTSPLRSTADIDGSIDLCQKRNAPSCVSVCKTEKSPYWMYSQEDNGRLHKLIETTKPSHRRQDLPSTVALNGAVYVVDVPWFYQHEKLINDETVGYEMPRERSPDIDTELDMLFVETILANRDNENEGSALNGDPSGATEEN